MRSAPSWSQHGTKAPPPHTITSGIRIPIYELGAWGEGHSIQTIASYNSNLSDAYSYHPNLTCKDTGLRNFLRKTQNESQEGWLACGGLRICKDISLRRGFSTSALLTLRLVFLLLWRAILLCSMFSSIYPLDASSTTYPQFRIVISPDIAKCLQKALTGSSFLIEKLPLVENRCPKL